VDNECWNKIAQTGSFIFNTIENSIGGVGWQVSSRENVTKEFRDGGREIELDADTTVQLYPIILLLGGKIREICRMPSGNSTTERGPAKGPPHHLYTLF
jgi:hypothetical protein